MIYSWDKFLRPVSETDTNIQILNNSGVITNTINPFAIINVLIHNNIVRVSLKSGRVIDITFSTINESKMALPRIKQLIDKLQKKTPLYINNDLKNYINSVNSKFYYQDNIPVGSGTNSINPGSFWYDIEFGILYVYVYDTLSGYNWVTPVGDVGQNGTSGTSGNPGSQGPQGDDGHSAYDIWLDQDNIGNLDMFFSSISGTSGTSGLDGTSGTSGLDGTSGTSISSPYTGNLQINGQIWTGLSDGGTSSSTATINFNNSNILTYTLGDSTTFTLSNMNSGGSYIVIIRQAISGGPYTSTFDGVIWSGVGLPTQTITSGKYDVYTFIYDGTNTFGSYIQNY